MFFFLDPQLPKYNVLLDISLPSQKRAYKTRQRLDFNVSLTSAYSSYPPTPSQLTENVLVKLPSQSNPLGMRTGWFSEDNATHRHASNRPSCSSLMNKGPQIIQPAKHNMYSLLASIYIIKLEIIVVACGEDETEDWGGKLIISQQLLPSTGSDFNQIMTL